MFDIIKSLPFCVILVPVCFSLKKQKETEAVEIKKSALEDSSNDMSDDEHKKDRTDKTELNHTKVIKSSSSTVKKNPLQNTAKLGKYQSFVLCCSSNKSIFIII